MRLISLNVQKAKKDRGQRQVDALVAREPDIIALSDVAIPRFSVYRRAFEERGYKHVYRSVPDGTPPVAEDHGAGVLVASKYGAVASLKPSPAPVIPWPERLLSVTLDTPWGEVDLYNAYVPWTYLKPTRLATLEALYTGLAHATDRHRILCGDLNLTRHEMTDGTVVTWGQHMGGQLMGYPWAERADAVERGILLGLADYDLYDVYRRLHGYAKQEFSWYTPTKDHTGYRIDHILASSSLRATECRDLHQFREPWGGTVMALSDHSAIEVVFDPVDLDDFSAYPRHR